MTELLLPPELVFQNIMQMVQSVAIIAVVFIILYKFCGGKNRKSRLYPDLDNIKSNSLLNMYNARHVNAIVDQFTSLTEVSKAVRQAGLESSNLIFGKYSKFVNNGIFGCPCNTD